MEAIIIAVVLVVGFYIGSFRAYEVLSQDKYNSGIYKIKK